jgi:hypothetical protein
MASKEVLPSNCAVHPGRCSANCQNDNKLPQQSHRESGFTLVRSNQWTVVTDNEDTVSADDVRNDKVVDSVVPRHRAVGSSDDVCSTDWCATKNPSVCAVANSSPACRMLRENEGCFC